MRISGLISYTDFKTAFWIWIKVLFLPELIFQRSVRHIFTIFISGTRNRHQNRNHFHLTSAAVNFLGGHEGRGRESCKVEGPEPKFSSGYRTEIISGVSKWYFRGSTLALCLTTLGRDGVSKLVFWELTNAVTKFLWLQQVHLLSENGKNWNPDSAYQGGKTDSPIKFLSLVII